MARGARRGSVLILAMALVAALSLVATAFIITARLESRAATNALRGLQAEGACRAGLAAAISRAQQLYDLGSAVAVYSTDSWHEHFYDASGPDLCPDSWVEHYDPAVAKSEMKARRWAMPRTTAGDPASAGVKQLKRARGFSAEYYVAVADLDGKLHCNPKNWIDPALLTDAEIQEIYKSLFKAEHGEARAQTIATSIVTRTEPLWSLGQMRAAFSLADKDEMKSAESALTTYPRKLSAGERPAVNANTVRRDVLKAIVLKVPGFTDTLAANVADKLIGNRPLPGRAKLEEALDDLAPNPIGDGTLSEQQFNDLLNSLNYKEPSIYASNGKHSTGTGGDSGVYEYDFDNLDPNTQNKGGDKTSAVPEATWGAEVKFVSRFYHVYVLGRTVSDEAAPRTMSSRRCHAVYDAGARRVLWLRWHFYRAANVSDLP